MTRLVIIITIMVFLVGCLEEIDSPALQNEPELTAFDLTKGWFPHEVGNYWIKEDFIECTLVQQWIWEVKESFEVDSAQLFKVEKVNNPCEGEEMGETIYWYSLTKEDVLYQLDEDLNFIMKVADFKLDLDESFIGNDLRYTVVEKSENTIVFEYDLYNDGTYQKRWYKGLGINLNWTRAIISGIEYDVDEILR